MLPVEKEDHPTLEAVQDLFGQWRREKKHHDPIPPALWDAALSLAADHSLYAIAKRLRLNYVNFKARTTARATATGVPAFIELGPVPAVDCTVELTKPSGERMTITGGCNVTDLVRVFLM